jgi:hypothetical protein
MSQSRFLALFALVLVLRVVIAAQFRGNYDSESFRIVGDLTLSGHNVYESTERYNYSPAWALIVAALWRLARPNFFLFVLLLGLLQIAADAASALVVSRIARGLSRGAEEARRAALLFFSNPVSVLASCAHGQFDGLAILLLLAAIAVSLGDGLERRTGRVALLLSASLVLKHVTAFHPLLFWRRVRRPGLSDFATAAPYAALAAAFLPFAASWRAIWKNVVEYGTKGARPGGLLAVVDVPAHARLVFTALLATAVAWAIREGRDLELPRAALVLWLAVLSFLPSYGIQYLVWPIAVGSLYPSLGLGLYTLAGALFHSAWSLELAWPVRVSSLGTWLAGILWLIAEASRARRERLMPRAWAPASTAP